MSPSPPRRTRAPRKPAGAELVAVGVFRAHVRGFGFVDLDEPPTTAGAPRRCHALGDILMGGGAAVGAFLLNRLWRRK